jgi:hypothetical protein
MQETAIVEKLAIIEHHAHRAHECGKVHDWRNVEIALQHLQVSVQAIMRDVEKANDIKRGQMP